jgi:TonB family protein
MTWTIMPTIELADLLDRIAAASLPVYWMPMALWSVMAFAFLLLRRLLQNQHPAVGYQAVTALLLSLPLGMLLATLSPMAIPAPHTLQEAVTYVMPSPTGELAFNEPAAASEAIAWSPMYAVGLLVLFVAGFACWQLGRLSLETMRLVRIGRSLAGQPLDKVDADLDRLRGRWAIDTPITVVFSDLEHAPMTFGWRRPLIVIPASLRKDTDGLKLALLHEMIHIRQGDYARRWVEQCIRALFFFHPLVHHLADAIDRYREMACDTEVLSQKGVSVRRYAALLLAFADHRASIPQTALSMSDSPSNLKDRIHAMNSQNLFSTDSLHSRKTAFLLAGALLTIATLIVACEVTFETDNSVTVIEAPETTSQSPDQDAAGVMMKKMPPPPPTAGPNGEDVFMIVESMPELIGGLQSIQENIKYPAIAQKAGIEGRVFVQFVVNEEGAVENPVVVRGIGAGCDEEAIRAVRLAQFEPGRQKGLPVKVKMSIPVTFRLSSADPATGSLIENLKIQSTQLNQLLEMLQAAEKTNDIEKIESLKKAIARYEATIV